MTAVAASPASQTLTAAPPATGAMSVAQGFANVFAGLFEGETASGATGAAALGAPPATTAGLAGLGAGSRPTSEADPGTDDDEVASQDPTSGLAPSTVPVAPAPIAPATGGGTPADPAAAAVSAGVGPNVPTAPAIAKKSVQSKPATQIESSADPVTSDPATSQTTSDAPAAAKAALALDAGVTRIVGQIAAGTPRLETPSALKPPQVGAATQGKPGKTDGTETDGAKTDGAVGASAKMSGVQTTTASSDAPAPSPADDASAAAGARPEGGPAAASDRPVAGSPIQTAAAPATPQAATQQGPAATTAIAAHAVTQLATEVASKAGARRTRFEVRLDPGELGRVDVRLDIGQDGRLSTRLIVERPETLDMLRNDFRELARSLEQAGFQLGQGGLAFQLRDGRQGWRSEAPSASGTNANEIDEAAPAAPAYARPGRSASGGVDVTV